MSSLAVSPLLAGAAVGVADELIANATNASIAVKGSYLPRFGFEAGVVAAGTVLGSRGWNKNLAVGAAVGAAAILGRDLAYVFNGTIKL